MLRVGARLLVAKRVKLLAVLDGVIDFMVAEGRKAFCSKRAGRLYGGRGQEGVLQQEGRKTLWWQRAGRRSAARGQEDFMVAEGRKAFCSKKMQGSIVSGP